VHAEEVRVEHRHARADKRVARFSQGTCSRFLRAPPDVFDAVGA
jgi:hypothetical protein